MIKKEDLLEQVEEKKRLLNLLDYVESEILGAAHLSKSQAYVKIPEQDSHLVTKIQRVLTVSGYTSYTSVNSDSGGSQITIQIK